MASIETRRNDVSMTAITFRVGQENPFYSKQKIESVSGDSLERRTTEAPSKGDLQRARLKALARRALADAWARGATANQADKIAAQIIHEKFPKMSAGEVFDLIEFVRGNSK